MTSRRVAVHESERTPQMLMQAWMLNVMLERDKQLLGRSETLVCNRITIEQKLLCKRYKKKLHDSKIKFARITREYALSVHVPQTKTACIFRRFRLFSEFSVLF